MFDFLLRDSCYEPRGPLIFRQTDCPWVYLQQEMCPDLLLQRLPKLLMAGSVYEMLGILLCGQRKKWG